MKVAILKQFIKKPRSTGAIFPSSSHLAHTITSDIALESANTVVELGPGTGAFTGKILDMLQPEANFFAVELNPDMLQVFEKNYPGVKVYNDSASNLDHMLSCEELESADIVVSGLPWASFPDKVQSQILSAIVASLSKDGYFVTFAYLQGMLLPAARRFKKRLQKQFSSVKTSRVVWKNLPPAFVYRCKK